MTVYVLTKGSHKRNVHVPPYDGTPRQFAHRWDPDDVEDVPHQAQNFKLCADALGGYVAPIVLLAPPLPEGPEADHIKVNLSDWKSIIETGMGVPVEIR
jgi:hypothetical protein